MVKDALRQYNVKSKGEVLTKYFQPNNDALKAFQNRVENGMHLSDKLWQHTNGIQKELEAAISTAVEKGTSAVKLSKQVSKYLNDAEQLRKDYKDKFNKATDIHDCEYRSARLARSEINIAYRTAEQTRWQQLDFVVGYEIKPSANHKVEDICDILAGRYPKDFKWVGWHPNCTDFAIPILKTEDEFFDDDRTTKSKNEVTDVPESFKQWCRENEQNIAIADKQGTLPYFIKDNKAKVNDIIKDNKTSVVAKKEIKYVGSSNDTKVYRKATIEDIKHVENELQKAFDDIAPENNNKQIYITTNVTTSNSDGDTYFWGDINLRPKQLDYFVSAIDALQNGTSLTNNELRGLNSALHEMMHNVAIKGENIGTTYYCKLNRELGEMTNEYLTRRYTFDFCKRFDADISGLENIVWNDKRNAYDSFVRNFRYILKNTNLDENIVMNEVSKFYLNNNLTDMETSLAEILCKCGLQHTSGKLATIEETKKLVSVCVNKSTEFSTFEGIEKTLVRGKYKEKIKSKWNLPQW